MAGFDVGTPLTFLVGEDEMAWLVPLGRILERAFDLTIDRDAGIGGLAEVVYQYGSQRKATTPTC